jgi:hypothetical protein
MVPRRGIPIDGDWRSGATVALASDVPLPLWVWITGLNQEPLSLVVLSGILGVDIGLGRSATGCGVSHQEEVP